MIEILMMTPKLAALSFHKMKVFSNNSFCMKIPVHEITSKILLRESNYILDAIMWSKFVTVAYLWENLLEFDQKNTSLERCACFKFNKFKLALRMALIFKTNVARGLQLKVRKFGELILRFLEITVKNLIGWYLFVEVLAENLVGEAFLPFPSRIGLKD